MVGHSDCISNSFISKCFVSGGISTAGKLSKFEEEALTQQTFKIIPFYHQKISWQTSNNVKIIK